MKQPKPTEKQCRACKATIDYRATRCRYCTEPQSNARAIQEFGKGMIALGCLLPFAILLIVFCIAVLFPSPPPKTHVKIEDRYPGIVNLAIIVDGSVNDHRIIEAAGSTIGALTTTSRAALPKSPDDHVGIEVRAGGKRIMHLTYTVAALEEVRGREPAEILGAADSGGHWTPDNDLVINRFCLDHLTAVYCQRVKAGEL